MGAWGAGSFDNDAAQDWLTDLERASADHAAAKFLRDAIEPLADPALGYLDLDEACGAIAAGEIVAAILGRPATGLPEAARQWVAEDGAALVDTARALEPLALAALNRVKSASELHDLWAAEGAAAQEFYAAVDELHERLRGAGGAPGGG